MNICSQQKKKLFAERQGKMPLEKCWSITNIIFYVFATQSTAKHTGTFATHWNLRWIEFCWICMSWSNQDKKKETKCGINIWCYATMWQQNTAKTRNRNIKYTKKYLHIWIPFAFIATTILASLICVTSIQIQFVTSERKKSRRKRGTVQKKAGTKCALEAHIIPSVYSSIERTKSNWIAQMPAIHVEFIAFLLENHE